jgi:hypothetical protein
VFTFISDRKMADSVLYLYSDTSWHCTVITTRGSMQCSHSTTQKGEGRGETNGQSGGFVSDHELCRRVNDLHGFARHCGLVNVHVVIQHVLLTEEPASAFSVVPDQLPMSDTACVRDKHEHEELHD